MTREEKAIVYFKDMRKRLCEDYLSICPKDSIAYKATLAEKDFYDSAINALEKEINCETLTSGYVQEIKAECGDCISRQAAIDAADKIIERDTSGSNAVVNAMIAWSAYIKGLPPITPAEKVRRLVDTDDGHSVECSECGKWFFHGYLAKIEIKYCPNCGARMEVEE